MNLSLLLLSYSASLHTSGEWHLVFVTAAYCNLMIIIFSLNPLLYSDGYYVFSTLLKMPNLRKSSSKSILKIMTGKAKSEDIVYGIYFAIVLTLATLFVIPELYHTIVSTILRIQEGMTVWEVIRQFANVFIMLALGVFASLFAKRTKKRDVDIGTHEEV